jgi:hypothetical protein
VFVASNTKSTWYKHSLSGVDSSLFLYIGLKFGTVSKTRITKICKDEFGAVKGHDGQKRSRGFNKIQYKR